MAGIKEFLQQILSARYGKDVRQAIHDGIQQCYYDGKAGTVDLEARENIEAVEAKLSTVESIAKGKNKARVFSTTEAMNAWLSDGNKKGVANVGDNLYIIDVGVPDWWIAKVLEAPNENGMYYEIAPLETQKVDLITIEDAINDINENLVKLPKTKYISEDKSVLSIAENGKYYCLNAKDLPANEDTYGYLDVTVHPNDLNYRVIRYTPINSNEIHQNILHDGTWQGWKSFAKNSDLVQINDNIGNIRYVGISNNIGTDANGKPWLLVRNVYEQLKAGYVLVGNVYAGTTWQVVGSKVTQDYGSFILWNYSGTAYLTWVSAGTWRYRQFALTEATEF